MYNSHYNYKKKKYGQKDKSLLAETSSLTYEIQTNDVYKDLKKDKNNSDFSEYGEKFLTL